MISKNIELATSILKNQGIIGFPTETVYGLAGNAFSEIAVKKIYELKNRPYSNPLIVHIKSSNVLKDVVSDIPHSVQKLADCFWPGPLTLVLPKNKNIPNIVTAGKDTVAIRVPSHPMALELLNKLDFPLAAPSANPFGSISPTSCEHVYNYFKDDLEIILDGGNCQSGIESTIIGFKNNQPILYRHGSISINDIEKIVGPISIYTKDSTAPEAPGMHYKHYAPITKTYFTPNVEETINLYKGKKIGVLVFKTAISNPNIVHQEVLSPKGDLAEAAFNLYSALHRLDQFSLDILIAEEFPNENLGKTINDRLERAAN